MKSVLNSFAVAIVLSTSLFAHAEGANLPLPPPVSKATQSPQVRCMKAFTTVGYTVNDTMVQACRTISGSIGAAAIEAITKGGAELTMDTIQAAAQVSTSYGLNCLRSFTAQGYGISETIIRTCMYVNNDWAARAIDTITSTQGEISMDALSALTQINGRHSLKCVRTLKNNGYGIGTNDSIIRTCQNFNSDEADASLEALAKTQAEITMDTLEQISRM